MMAKGSWKNPWALSGPFFVALFVWGLILGGVLSSASFPMPGAPPSEVARYYAENRAAVLAAGSLQVLSSLALFAFASRVTAFVNSAVGRGGALARAVSGGGVLAATLLLTSALLGLVLALADGELGLGLVGTLRRANFLTGGTLHVASLGLLVGAGSIAARRAKAVPRWVPWLGIAAAALAIASLASLVWFPATYLIPLGRLLSFVWCVAVGLVLALGGHREAVAGG